MEQWFGSIIKKRLARGILIVCAAMTGSAGQSAYADTGVNDCDIDYTCGDVPNWNFPGANPNPNFPNNPFYGAVGAGRNNYNGCIGFYTKSANTDTWDGKASDQPNTQCTTKLLRPDDARGNDQYISSSPQALQQLDGGGASADIQGPYSAWSNAAMVDDLLWFETPNASSTSPAEIPFKLCFKYDTVTGPNPTNSYADAEVATQLWKFVYNGSMASQIAWSWNAGGGNTINRGSAPNWTTNKCNAGKFTLTGPGGIYTARTTWGTRGTQYFHPLPIYQYRRNGKVQGCFQITPYSSTQPLPPNVTCKSASGVFPGCEWPIDPDEFCGENKKKEPDQSCSTTANPINFAYGFKVQSETDYSGSGALGFTRIYRSNGTWLNFNLGKYWRHNYDRSLEVINGPTNGSDSAQITTAEGTAYKFRSDAGANDWQALDSDVKATFTELYDATPTLIGYLYTDENKTKETYNTSKKLTRIEYQGGEALDLTYDGSGRLSTVTDEHGRVITLTYDGSSRVATAVTPDGTFTYTYGTNNNLTQVTKPDTKTRIYHYEDTTFVNALTGITNEDSVRYATWGYDAQGRADSSEHAGGVDEFTLTYNSDGTITETNPLGKQTIYTYTVINGVRKITKVDGVASTHCPAANKLYTYNSSGYLASKTDWEGNVTTYVHDANGLETSRVEAVGTPEERTITTTWVPSLRLPDVITEAGKTTDYAYDADGRMTSVTVTDTNTSETRTTTYTYWSNSTGSGGQTILGRLKEIDGPRTDVTDKTTFTYDSDFRLIKTEDALGHETETTAFDAADRPLTVEDENDVETDMTYDTLGRLLTHTRAPGTALEAVTTFTYNDVGDVETIESPNGTTVTYSYDNARRLTGMEDDLGNTITYTLDDAGNILTEERRDPGNTLKYTHTQTFDEMSRLLTSVGAGAAWDRSYAYDKNSNMTTYTDANSNATNYAFDGLDRLVTSTDALSGVTENTINDLDQTTGIEDPRTNVTTYGYNAFGDVTQIVSPDTGTATYTHDKAGNVTQMIDARSVTTNYTYDAINRLLTVAYPSDSSLNVTLTYDDNPTPGNCGTSIGRLCRVVDASGTTDYKYNDLGHLIEVKEVRGALTFTTAYEYDLAGVLKKITLPSGREIDYTLNGNGQVTSVSADVNGSAVTLASSITYLPYGPLTGLTYGNSKTLSATYDQDYRPTNRTVSGLFNHTYDTDDEGNITQKGSRTYAYDDLNRMDAEAGGTAASFTYDPIGNRLTEVTGSTTTYTYPSTNSKVSSVGANSYTYDAMGNVTADGTRTYVWSAVGLLKEAKVGGSTVGAYTYGYNNQRTKKVAGGNTTHYVYGLGGLLYGEYDNTGALIREYVWLNGEPLAQIDAGSPEVLTYIHTDHLMTPRYGTNAGGSTVWTWDAGAFGKETPTGSATLNLRFPGQYYDSESTLHYNWNRYYNPATGRFISSDPIGLAGGLNPYAYSSLNPLLLIDPLGLRPLTQNEVEFIREYFGSCLDSKLRGFNVFVLHDGDDGAISLPFGEIGMPRGSFFLREEENELLLDDPGVAAVFGHEVLHQLQRKNGVLVTAHAGSQQIASLITLGLFDPYHYKEHPDPDVMLEKFKNAGPEVQGAMFQRYIYLLRSGNIASNFYEKIGEYVKNLCSCEKKERVRAFNE
ncbi:MAG: RHS repeat protein [Alphaproteobacteria bacterium]|nr:RHS repeat protein [Alphaproteobacteria bacterium]